MTEPTATSTIFEQVGGRDVVGRIVERFYVYVEADAPLRAIYPEELGPGKEKLKLFFEQWLGGEGRYSALYGHPRLRLRHISFQVTEQGAGRWLRHMRQAMLDEQVPEETIRTIFGSLGPLAHHMVNVEGTRTED